MQKRPTKIDCEETTGAHSGDFLQLYFAIFAIIQSTYSRILSNSRHSHLMHISLYPDNHSSEDRWSSAAWQIRILYCVRYITYLIIKEIEESRNRRVFLSTINITLSTEI